PPRRPKPLTAAAQYDANIGYAGQHETTRSAANPAAVRNHAFAPDDCECGRDADVMRKKTRPATPDGFSRTSRRGFSPWPERHPRKYRPRSRSDRDRR